MKFPLHTALFLFCLPLPGQRPADSPSEKITIEGTVVRAGSGDPLRKAQVVLQKAEGVEPARPLGAVTDDDGRFLITVTDPGRYILSASRNGYVHQQYGQRGPRRPGTTLTLGRGQRLRDIVFRLVPTAVISGRVVDEDGEPLPAVQVQALTTNYREGRRQLGQVSMTATNDLGEYRLYGLAPGRYHIRAVYTPGLSALVVIGNLMQQRFDDTAAEESYLPTYYPGANDPTQASPVDAAAGSEVRGIDISFHPARAVHVRGQLFNAVDGGPVRNGNAWLAPREAKVVGFSRVMQSQFVSPQGEFEIRGVTPGSYILLAHAPSKDGSRTYRGRLPLEVANSNIDGIKLLLNAGLDLAGRIRMEGEGRLDPEALGLWLQPRDQSQFGGEGGQVKPDGTFSIPGLAPGAYAVHVGNLPEDFYLKSARLGDEEVLEAGLDLSRFESAPGLLEVVVSSKGGRIDGVVSNDKQKPAGGAQVVLIPESRRRSRTDLFKSTPTDQNGRFTLRGIPPGEYKLFAWEDIERGAYQDPEFLKPFEERGHACQVQAGGAQAVELQLIQADESP
ncbi:MAG: carboxypeptidase regulatory-like domain-containing protein [Acidobacteria bacterium]|nr:carboxypeptidase regulatory-like domain-containing protein [Acidobacteriota bacterium]